MRNGHARAIGASIVVAVLAGCAGSETSRPVAAPASAASAPAIAVVSMLGEKAQLVYIGTTIFNNGLAEAPAESWELDREIHQAASRLLQQRGQRVVGTPEADGSALGTFKLKFMGGDSFEARAGAIPAFANSVGAQKVLVIGPGTSGDPFFASTEPVPGYGVAQRSVFGVHGAVSYLRLTAVLLDGATGKELKKTYANASSDRNDTLWLENEHLVLEGQNAAATRAAIIALIPQAIEEVLEDISGKL